MVSPTQRRDGVVWATGAYRVSERRAIRALGVPRSTVRYRSIRPVRDPLRQRIREISAARVSYGYRCRRQPHLRALETSSFTHLNG